MSSMKKTYGSKKAKQVFYASKNSGKITGVDKHFYGHLSPNSVKTSSIKTTGGSC